MADHNNEHEKHESAVEPTIDKMTEKFGSHDSSSSDSDEVKDIKSAAAAAKAKAYRIFGREQPVHKVLGGGKPADIFLWRDKKTSGGVLGVATTIWVFFELLEYHLLSLVCHILICALAILFLWSNGSSFVNKSPPKIPEVMLPEDVVLSVASAFRMEFNKAFSILRDVACGRDLKKFLSVFTIRIYIGFVLLHTVPLIYEKYDDQIDAFAEKAEAEFKKQYAVFDAKVLSKLPKSIKDKLA